MSTSKKDEDDCGQAAENPEQQTDAGSVAAPQDGSRAGIRRARILQAALEVFLEKGYEAASMAEILAKAGGSMSTVYNHFEDKEGLFQAVVDHQVELLTRYDTSIPMGDMPIADGLRRIGVGLLMRILSPASSATLRLMVSQSMTFPNMINPFTQQVPDRTRRAVADYLQHRVDAGDIVIRDCLVAAGLFTDMLRGRLQIKALLDPDYKADEAEVRDIVDAAVQMFLGGASAITPPAAD